MVTYLTTRSLRSVMACWIDDILPLTCSSREFVPSTVLCCTAQQTSGKHRHDRQTAERQSQADVADRYDVTQVTTYMYVKHTSHTLYIRQTYARPTIHHVQPSATTTNQPSSTNHLQPIILNKSSSINHFQSTNPEPQRTLRCSSR